MSNSRGNNNSGEVVSSSIPYQPKQVSNSQLDSNGMIIPAETIAKIRQAIRDGKIKVAQNGSIRISKKTLMAEYGIPAKHSIIIAKDENGHDKIFALCPGVKHGKQIGQGATGVVKVVQDTVSGEFFALKVQANSTADQKQLFDGETNMLHKAHQLEAKGTYAPKSERKKQKYGNAAGFMIMKLAPGIESRLLIEENISPASRAAIVKSSMENLHRLHQDGILHLDIKPENFVANKANKESKLIDLGFSKDMDAKREFKSTQIIGTVIYMAPEVRSQYHAQYNNNDGSKKEIIYTEASDVYSMGLAAAKLFKLTKEVKQTANDSNKLAIKETNDPGADSIIKDENLRSEMINFLKRMTADNPKDRPSMQEAIAYMASVEQRLCQQPDSELKIAIVDVNLYQEMNDEQKKEYVRDLCQYDEVQLVATDRHIDIKKVGKIAAELTNNGLLVNDKIEHGNTDLKNIAAKLINNANVNRPNIKYQIVMPNNEILANLDNSSKSIKSPAKSQGIIPPLVKQTDLSANGKLVTEKMQHDIKQAILNDKIKLGKGETIRLHKSELLGKAGIRSPCSIVARRNDNGDIQLFAIYKGAKQGLHLGAGVSGSVKIIQDLSDGNFHAIKIQKSNDNTEIAMLQKTGDYIGHFTYKTQTDHYSDEKAAKDAIKAKKKPSDDNEITRKKGSISGAMIIKLAPGKPLDKYSENEMSPGLLAQVMVEMANQVRKYHDLNILHNDIKPDQFIYDKTSRAMKLVDVGRARDLDKNPRMVVSGAKAYTPPGSSDTRELIGKEKSEILAHDIYSLGITLAQVAGLVKMNNSNNRFEVVDRNDPLFINNKRIPDASQRGILIDFLKRMTDVDPNKRPKIEEVQDFCRNHSIAILKTERVEYTGNRTEAKYEIPDTNKSLLTKKNQRHEPVGDDMNTHEGRRLR